jgi:hypothetical protein
MSQFKVSVIRKDGLQHESTFAGWNAERAMSHFSKEAREDSKSLFVAIFEGTPEPIAAEGSIKSGAVVWSVYGTFRAGQMPGEAPTQQTPPFGMPPAYSVGDYVAIVGKTHAYYGHNGKITDTSPGGVTLELTTGPSIGQIVPARFEAITHE